MELTELLNAGGIAGLVGNAINSLIMFAFGRLWTAEAIPATAEQHWLSLLTHLAAGVGLGLVFWLSWGFTAIVGVAWWQRGLIFGLTTWALCCVPLVSAHWMTQRSRGVTTAIIAAQWFMTFVLAGLACAWSWGPRS